MSDISDPDKKTVKKEDPKSDKLDMYVIETNIRHSVLELIQPVLNKIQLEKQNIENLK